MGSRDDGREAMGAGTGDGQGGLSTLARGDAGPGTRRRRGGGGAGAAARRKEPQEAGERSLRRPRLGTNPRPAPRTATVVAGDGRGDNASRGEPSWARSGTPRVRGRTGSLVSSRRRVNSGSPVSSCRQAHGAVFSSDHRWRSRSDDLFASLLLFLGRHCGPVATFTGRQDNAPAFLPRCYRWSAAARPNTWGSV